MKKTAKQWKDYYSTCEFKEKFLYEGNDLGADCTDERTVFKLWSPDARSVKIRFYKDGGNGKPEGQSGRDYPGTDISGAVEEAFLESHEMERCEKGVWKYEAPGDWHGIYYDFEPVIEGEKRRCADPYAKACGLNGVRSMAVNLRRTDPDGWENDAAPEPTEEQFIYETHVKEFSWDASGGFPEKVRGKYAAFLYPDTTLYNDGEHPTGLAYLKRLGVTHIQLMPVYDYGSVDEAEDCGYIGDQAEQSGGETGRTDGKTESGKNGAGKNENGEQFNWGYDPVNYNAPEGSYSSDPARGEVRIKELKEAVQSLHRQGFRVIMDVVYNHTYSLDSSFQKTAPWYFYRVHEDGRVSNGSACGNDMASERYMCGKYILESVLYWAEEYHMDGFRFDLMGLLDTGLMNRIRKELDKRYGKGEKLIYGEPWAAAETAIEDGAYQALKKNMRKLDENIGMFSDDTRDALKGSVFKLDVPGFVNGAEGLEADVLKSVKAWNTEKEPTVKAASQVITYVSSHDNQTLWDKLAETTENEALRRKEYRLAAGIYMTCQGRPFFLSGEEFLRTKDGIEDSYNASITINRLDWNRAWEEKETVDYYRGLIALRKQLPGLYDKSAAAAGRVQEQWIKDGAAGFCVDNICDGKESLWEKLCIVYNRNEEPEEIRLPEGEWQILADGENSFLWRDTVTVSEKCEAAPVSVLILGKRKK